MDQYNYLIALHDLRWVKITFWKQTVWVWYLKYELLTSGEQKKKTYFFNQLYNKYD